MSQSSFGGLLDLMGFWRSESRISYSSGQQSDDDEQKQLHTHTPARTSQITGERR